MTNNPGRTTGDRGHKARPWRLALCPLALVLSSGCAGQLNPFHKDDPPPVAKTQESVVLRPDGLARAATSPVDTDPDLLAAKEVFRRGEYAKAEVLFHQIAEGSKGDGPWWSLGIGSNKDKDEPQHRRG